MQPARPNENGVLEEGWREIVANWGRAYAAVRIALCEDGLYRCGVDLQYSHGGLSSPISIHNPGHATLDRARTAALESLIRSWHTPFPSDPDGVRAELDRMREQVESSLQQPCLF